MKNRIFILLIGAAFFLGCEERYFIDLNQVNTEQLVINGVIDQSSGPYYVSVQRTIGPEVFPQDVSDAEVILLDERGHAEYCDYVGEGRYSCPGIQVNGQAGVAYNLKVKVGSRNYTSIPDRMPAITASSVLDWEEDQIKATSAAGVDISYPSVNFNLNTEVPSLNQSVFLLWIFNETFQIRETDFPDPFGVIPPPCYVTKNVGRNKFELMAFNPERNLSTNISEVIMRPVDLSFLVKHLFITYQHSLSQEHFDYLSRVKILSESTGSLFDRPAGRIKGNIISDDPSDQPLGFFGAVLADTVYNVIYPNEIDYWFEDGCLYVPGKTRNDYERFCIDCRSFSGNSTKDKPYYWDFIN